jgi:hypothetical protein
MKKILIFALLTLSAVSAQAQLKPFVSFDYADEEKRSSGSKNAAVNMTVGVKAPNKWEYSIKAGYADPATPGTSSSSLNTQNVELKVKKSFETGMGFYPYVSVRVGQKFNDQTTIAKNTKHYAVDIGLKVPLGMGFAADVGSRYRNAFNEDQVPAFDSVRHHAMLLYDFIENHTVGLRYARSHGALDESKNSVRAQYTYNF